MHHRSLYNTLRVYGNKAGHNTRTGAQESPYSWSLDHRYYQDSIIVSIQSVSRDMYLAEF